MSERCFAYCTKSNGIATCSILKVMLCDSKKCTFFKTQEQYEKDIEKADKRLKVIGVPTDVIKKYHK
jgi:hypothetical protein